MNGAAALISSKTNGVSKAVDVSKMSQKLFVAHDGYADLQK